MLLDTPTRFKNRGKMTIAAQDGYLAVSPGKLAAVVTSLEMTTAPSLDPPAAPPGAALARLERPPLEDYRRLFRAVGQDWLWFSRLRMADDELAAVIHDPAVAVHVLTVNGAEAGLLELDFRDPGQCEIAFFGLIPQFVGRGIGGFLMREAISRAWQRPIRRLWVHTCTLDHPAALPFYIRCGFRAFRRQVEIADDPRTRGELPATAAPQIPLL